MRVLIVEDSADLCDALLRHLRGQGHAVDCAATGSAVASSKASVVAVTCVK